MDLERRWRYRPPWRWWKVQEKLDDGTLLDLTKRDGTSAVFLGKQAAESFVRWYVRQVQFIPPGKGHGADRTFIYSRIERA